LDVLEGLTAVHLVPAPIEGLGRDAELDDEVARKVLRLEFTALLVPKAEEGRLVAPIIILASEPPMNDSRLGRLERVPSGGRGLSHLEVSSDFAMLSSP